MPAVQLLYDQRFRSGLFATMFTQLGQLFYL